MHCWGWYRVAIVMNLNAIVYTAHYVCVCVCVCMCVCVWGLRLTIFVRHVPQSLHCSLQGSECVTRPTEDSMRHN